MSSRLVSADHPSCLAWEAKLFSSVAITYHVVGEVAREGVTLTPIAGWSTVSPSLLIQMSMYMRRNWAFFKLEAMIFDAAT